MKSVLHPRFICGLYLLSCDFAALHHRQQVMFDRYFQSTAQFRSVRLAGHQGPFRQTTAERARDCRTRGCFDELPTVKQLAPQHNVRYAEAANHISDTDAEVCANPLECHLCASLTRICTRHEIDKSQRRTVSRAIGFATI